MGSSRYDGWDTKPKLEEARVLSPEKPPHRSRKDRKRWCRGKPGVAHQPAIRFSKVGQYMRDRYGPQDPHALCGWFDRHAWGWRGGQRRWLALDDWFWKCRHEHYCAECGKILDKVTRRDCPDFTPFTPGTTCNCYSCTKE